MFIQHVSVIWSSAMRWEQKLQAACFVKTSLARSQCGTDPWMQRLGKNYAPSSDDEHKGWALSAQEQKHLPTTSSSAQVLMYPG
jgi:hypothetical protein